MSVSGRVAELWRFPVKSMGGERLDALAIGADGVQGDRAFALHDPATGKVVSAKKPRPWSELLHYRAITLDGGGVRVTSPEGTEFDVGVDHQSLVDELTRRFGRPVTLEAAGAVEGPQYESEWPEIDGLSVTGDHTFPTNLGGSGSPFVDMSAIHLVTTTTVGAIDALVSPSTVDARRFRPNILIELDDPDIAPYVENGWTGATVRIGDDVALHIDMLTPRCIMTTLDQPGLDREPGVLRALATHNRVTESYGTFAMAGSYASVTNGGAVAAGDTVVVEPA